ncbi:hypothetical protein LSUE1_G007807 [Lachnellula suecica]|uniref:2EXR domain-containing protein n=1 Tax=Lachnellula suecica TaxID=602035 RepID=A0A8T9C449_9HELO|nr:hypothetical protein LSUE1_G007807 [Lachnellula suecica]
MSTPTEFHLFPNLPSEIRLKVWSFIVGTPRVVKIHCKKRIERNRRFADAFVSEEPPPIALHICQESRHEALSIYETFFTTARSPRYTYVAFDRDTIKFPDGTLEYIKPLELQSIQRMIMEVKDCAYFTTFHLDTVQKMQSLKELEIVTGGIARTTGTDEGDMYDWNGGGRYLTESGAEDLASDIAMARERELGETT